MDSSCHYKPFVNGFSGYCKVKAKETESSTSDLTLMPKWYVPFDENVLSLHHIGKVVTKLELIKLLITFWPYRSEIEGFDLIVIPWLELLSQYNYRFRWTRDCYRSLSLIICHLNNLLSQRHL